MIAVMLFGVAVLAGALSAAQPAAAKPAAPEATQVYRLDIAGHGTLWARDHPMQSGSMIVFHRFPDGVLVSIRRTDVTRIVAARYQASASGAIRPGGVIDLGITGGGGAAPAAAAAAEGGPTAPALPGLGERSDGTALFNPNRAYRPDWDSKQVPGLNLGNPAAPNDYQEGKTLAYPSASSTQVAPGDLPRAAVETGDPRSPQ